MITTLNHIALPSRKRDWDEIVEFWQTLGLRASVYDARGPEFDHAGSGQRLYLGTLTHMPIIVYVRSALTLVQIEQQSDSMHVAFDLTLADLEQARAHACFSEEVPWEMGGVSVFLKGPYGLNIELCTTRLK